MTPIAKVEELCCRDGDLLTAAELLKIQGFSTLEELACVSAQQLTSHSQAPLKRFQVNQVNKALQRNALSGLTE